MVNVAYNLSVNLHKIGCNTLISARQMLWKKKTPWFVATAAAFVVGSALAGAKYYLDSTGFAASLRPSRQSLNESRLEKANSWQQAYNSISNTYLQNRAKISSVLALTSDCGLWPAILNCLYDALPQATAAVPPATTGHVAAPEPTRIIIQSIESRYEPMLSSGGHSRNANAMPASPATYVPGRMSASGEGPALGTPGFAVTITGYTTVSHGELYSVLQNYRDRLRSVAPQDGKKLPFYIVIPRNDLAYGQIGRTGAAETAGFVPWGSHLGSFADVFLNKFLPPHAKAQKPRPTNTFQNNFQLPGNFPPGNFTPPGIPTFNGMPGYGGNVAGGFGAAFNGGESTEAGKLGIIDPDTKKSLDGAWAFRIRILIFLRR